MIGCNGTITNKPANRNLCLRFISALSKEDFLCLDNVFMTFFIKLFGEYTDYDERSGAQLPKKGYQYPDCKKILTSSKV